MRVLLMIWRCQANGTAGCFPGCIALVLGFVQRTPVALGFVKLGTDAQ
jgi:hypothetical protein